MLISSQDQRMFQPASIHIRYKEVHFVLPIRDRAGSLAGILFGRYIRASEQYSQKSI